MFKNRSIYKWYILLKTTLESTVDKATISFFIYLKKFKIVFYAVFQSNGFKKRNKSLFKLINQKQIVQRFFFLVIVVNISNYKNIYFNKKNFNFNFTFLFFYILYYYILLLQLYSFLTMAWVSNTAFNWCVNINK